MNITVTVRGLDEAIQALETHGSSLRQKANELCKRLADMGAVNVSLMFARAVYTGENDFDVSVEEAGNNGYRILVSGQSVLFVEFGAGITYGYGHPQPGKYGPGTYPGEGHWDDPNGWWIPGTGEHTYGNPPNMPMYNTAQDLKGEVERVAREVFSA